MWLALSGFPATLLAPARRSGHVGQVSLGRRRLIEQVREDADRAPRSRIDDRRLVINPFSDEMKTGPSSSAIGDAAVRAAHERRVERDHVPSGSGSRAPSSRASHAILSFGSAAPDRRTARPGRSRACGGCRRCARSRARRVVEPVVVGEPAIARRRSRRARPSARDRGRCRLSRAVEHGVDARHALRAAPATSATRAGSRT